MLKNLLSLFTILFLIACSPKLEPSEPWSVKNITQREERIALLMDKSPKSFELKLKGNTDGTYKIYLMSSSRQQANVTLNFNAGAIDTFITQAWIEPACKIIYVPDRVSTGQLDIDFKLISPN